MLLIILVKYIFYCILFTQKQAKYHRASLEGYIWIKEKYHNGMQLYQEALIILLGYSMKSFPFL